MSRLIRWNVRNRFLVAFLLVAGVPLVVFGGLVYARTSSALRKVERQQIVAQATGVREVLHDRTSDEMDFIRGYAVSDGLYKAVSGNDRRWIAANVTDWVLANSSTTLVKVFDPSGRHLAQGGDSAPSALWGNDEVQAARRGRTSADLEAIDGRLYVLAAAPIIRQSRPSKPVGVLVFGVAISDEVLQGINAYTGGEGRLAVYTQSIVSAASSPQDASAFATFRPADYRQGQVFHEGSYTSQLVAIRDKEGEIASLLKVSTPRRVFTDALSGINHMTMVAYGGAFVVALLMAFLVSLTVSRPLRRLAAAASDMAAGDLRQRLDLHRRDEIGSLANAFNVMSEQVAHRVDDLSRKTRTLALEISNLSAFGTTLAQTPDPHAELRRLADMIRNMHEADTAAIYLVYEGHVIRAAFSGGLLAPIPAAASDELAAWVVDNACSLEIDEVAGDARLSELARSSSPLASCLGVPLARQEGIVGALVVGFADAHEFGREELPLLTTIGGQIAIALQNAEAYEKLDRMYLETVTALAAAMEAKDQYTASHADSLASMAVAVGSRMGMSDGELRMLQYAAVLHDIGKIGIPGNILNKPDKLTRDEFETMAQHTIIGERIISRIDYLVPISRIIRSAHERWDGGGYPDGLEQEDIPLPSRILLVCDAFDAMTTDRPYRRALPIETALQELQANAGTQFDPRVVDIFLASYPFTEPQRQRAPKRLSYAGLVDLN